MHWTTCTQPNEQRTQMCAHRDKDDAQHVQRKLGERANTRTEHRAAQESGRQYSLALELQIKVMQNSISNQTTKDGLRGTFLCILNLRFVHSKL